MIIPSTLLAFLRFALASYCWLFGLSGIQIGPNNLIQQRDTRGVTALPPSEASTAPHCEITGVRDLKITCQYSPTRRSSTGSKDEIRLVLNRAVLSFGTVRDSFMFVDLTFTNEGASLIPGHGTVYLTIEDETGQNMVRRPLPKTDLSKLSPGIPTTFSERFLIGGFRRGRYTLSLLIPNLDPTQKNSPGHNMLLSSEGVPDPRNGSNTIAHFTIKP